MMINIVMGIQMQTMHKVPHHLAKFLCGMVLVFRHESVGCVHHSARSHVSTAPNFCCQYICLDDHESHLCHFLINIT